MINRIIRTATIVVRAIAQGIRIQLLLILCCLPITTYWGLAISYLSPIGNLIFIPFLTLFIFFGLLLLMGHFIGFPLAVPAYLLNQLTAIWIQLLDLAPDNTYIVLPAVFFPLSFCGPVLACYILYWQRYRFSPLHEACIISSFFVVLMATVTIYQKYTTTITHVRRAQVGATIMACNSQTIVIDWGGINAISGGLSWIQYQLTPEIYLKTGSTVIDYLIMVHPVKKIRGSLYAYARRLHIKTIIVPDAQSARLLHDHPLPGTPTIMCIQPTDITINLGDISLQLIYTNESTHARRISLLLHHKKKHVNLYHVWRHNYTQLANMAL